MRVAKIESMKLSFSIRDLLWITLVAAILLAWWMDHRRTTSGNEKHSFTGTANGNDLIRDRRGSQKWERKADQWILVRTLKDLPVQTPELENPHNNLRLPRSMR
jgi:hypothetical protein